MHASSLGLVLMNALQILKACMVEPQGLRQLHRTTAFNSYTKSYGCCTGEAPDTDPFGSEASDNLNGDGDGQPPTWRSLCMANMLIEALDIRGFLARITVSVETFK